MLYVFYVDTGTMLHLDMNLALDTVENLKQNIGKQFRIPEEKQVLLISGGESLNPEARVCSYSAGTDTNPIYLFSKSNLEAEEHPPIPTTEFGTDTDLSEQVEASLNMPPTYTTVVTRAQLALELYDQASKIIKDCEKLVHQQHLQQQGWAAVVANLEDTTQAFRSRACKFEENYASYLSTRNEYLHLLENFNEDLTLLGKIPMLPSLVSQENMSSDTLLHWISSKDDQRSLEQLAEMSVRGLNTFNLKQYNEIKKDVAGVMENVNNPTMKEIKGLEERLSGLEQLMYDSKLKVQEQKDQAAAFQQNQARAGNIGDPSILPDLCSSHRKQLQVMQRTHQQLRDIRRRCIRAKEELSLNLHARLRWITFVERGMCEVSNNMTFLHENLKRLRHHLEVVQQIHVAPKAYFVAVAEVVRRRSFSRNFLQWANNLSQQCKEMHTREIAMRKSFYAKMGSHFLLSLFHGMNDYPPPFATEAPLPFDVDLPPISTEDVERLKQLLPELAVHLEIDDNGFTPRFESPLTPDGHRKFRVELTCSAPALVHLGSETRRTKSDEATLCGSETARDGITGLVKLLIPEEAEDLGKDLESEAETEEFEKVDNVPESTTERGLFEIPEDEDDDDDDDRGISDAKHRRVESYSPDVDVETTECSTMTPDKSRHLDVSGCGFFSAVGAEDACRIPTSSASPADSCCAVSSNDFVTAEFYIDESMPSSYTESNEMTGPRTGVVVGGGPVLAGDRNGSGVCFGHGVKSHHVIVAELQRHLEEKNATIETLQDDVLQHQTRVQVVEGVLHAVYSLDKEKTAKLRNDIDALRQEVNDRGDDLKRYIAHAWSAFLEALAGVSRNLTQEQTEAVESAVASAQLQHESILNEFRSRLEIETAELTGVRNESRECQLQLEKKAAQLEELKIEYEKEVEGMRTRYQEEKQKMALEHELELDSTKEEMKKLLEIKDNELRELKDLHCDTSRKCFLLTDELNTTRENIRREFEQEKETLILHLRQEHSEAIENAVQQERATMQSELQRLQAEWDDRLLTNCKQAAAEATSTLEIQLQQALKDQQTTLETEWTQRIEDLTAELRAKHGEEMVSIKSKAQELEKEIESREERAKLGFEQTLAEAQSAWEKSRDCELNALRDRLVIDHKNEMEALRSRLRLATSSKSPTTVSPTIPSTPSLEVPPTSLLTPQQEEQSDMFQSSVMSEQDALRLKFEDEMAKLRQEHQEQLNALRSAILAEKQVSFNEAVNKVVEERDKIVEDQKQRENALLKQQEADRVLLQKLAAENRSLLDVEAQLQKYMELDKANRMEVDRLDAELANAQRKIEHLVKANEFHASTGEVAGGLITSVIPLENQERLIELESTLRFREEEMTKLQTKIMEMSMTSSAATLLQQDKVSVLSCNIGDLVLLCYNEKHENYLAFLVCPVYHFLHADCLEVLGLKPVSGENRKSWVLAEVTDKEYCQAKKSQNRYRVPIGTKFYRVRAKPWDKEPVPMRENRRSICAANSLPSSPTASQ